MNMVCSGIFSRMVVFQFEAQLTGIISPGKLYENILVQRKTVFLGVIEPDKLPMSGGLVAEGLYGPHHQHFFHIRIDWMLDGMKNSLVEVNCVPIPKGPQNPAGNAWVAEETVLRTVGEARRLHDAVTGRFWKVINPHVKNHN